MLPADVAAFAGEMDPMIAEYLDFLPVFGMIPELSAEEVERFMALGEAGWKRLRSGDESGAEAAGRCRDL